MFDQKIAVPVQLFGSVAYIKKLEATSKFKIRSTFVAFLNNLNYRMQMFRVFELSEYLCALFGPLCFSAVLFKSSFFSSWWPGKHANYPLNGLVPF